MVSSDASEPANPPPYQADRDLEAQQPSHVPAAGTANTAPSHPARAGRGGAGNYTESPSAAAEHEQSVARETAQAVKKHKPSGGAYAGRGGAGNWKEKGKRSEGEDDGEPSRLEEMERKAKEVVDQGLKMPEKVVMAKDKKKGLGMNGGEH